MMSKTRSRTPTKRSPLGSVNTTSKFNFDHSVEGGHTMSPGKVSTTGQREFNLITETNTLNTSISGRITKGTGFTESPESKRWGRNDGPGAISPDYDTFSGLKGSTGVHSPTFSKNLHQTEFDQNELQKENASKPPFENTQKIESVRSNEYERTAPSKSFEGIGYQKGPIQSGEFSKKPSEPMLTKKDSNLSRESELGRKRGSKESFDAYSQGEHEERSERQKAPSVSSETSLSILQDEKM